MVKLLINDLGKEVSLNLERQKFRLDYESSITISTKKYHVAFIRQHKDGKNVLSLHPQELFWEICPHCDGKGKTNILGDMLDQFHRQRCFNRLID